MASLLRLIRAAAVFSAALAIASSCLGAECAAPWINEFDYDSNDGGFNNDRDEFVELAAPAGTDISGYKVLAVEGNAAFFTCGSGIGGANGEAYFTAVIPNGIVIGDDTGTGVGFYVVCFQSTSANVVADGNCDAILPGVANDSNLKNGNLAVGGQTNCPDGVLLLDPADNLVDAISWEGIIPPVGSYGALFNAPNVSYNAGEDGGFVHGESLQKVSDAAGRAMSAAEWAVSGGDSSATPGIANPGQALSCFACGDGSLDPGEECDDGNLVNEDGCSDLCAIEECGDGVLQAGLGEQCDDGNTTSEDGCSDLCEIEACGDGVVQAGLGEQCDDGNPTSQDGCSAICVVEFCGDGVLQVGLGEQCDDGNVIGGDGCSATCQNETCGDGQLDAGEECDDGNLIPGDGCSAICTLELCGNGIPDPGEECDDGNTLPGDGCSGSCANEICGDGVLQVGLGEECDDGNLTPGDGCSDLCVAEFCGDGVLQSGLGEECDDGNTQFGDACLADCRLPSTLPGLAPWAAMALGLVLAATGALLVLRRAAARV